MAFLPGYASKIYVNEKAVCATVSSWSAQHQRAVSEVTAMCQTAGNAATSYVPGLMSGTLTMAGPQDSVGQNLHAEIAGAIGSDDALQVTLLPDGDTIGKWAIFGVFDPTEWTNDANVADAVGFTLSAAADKSIDQGFVIHGHGAETADGNGTAVDRVLPTSSTGGMFAVLHVTAYSGLTSAALKIQHSTDNSVWADLVAFTSVTAVGNQTAEVAAGTTINRYLRVVTDVTGTGSITFLAAAGPR